MTASKISIRTCRGTDIIECRDISYCQADGRYTRIFLKSGESYMVAKVLKQYENLLCPNIFFRVHKSYLVNMECIKHFMTNNGRTLTLDNNKKVVISKRRCKQFAKKIKEIFPTV
jgi:two-component system LytT family response regulator